MSYPLTIRPLIIEDNPEVKEAYTRIFREISRQLPWSLLPAIDPCFALSFEDGLAQLGRSVAFHLVILDLELPQKAGRPAQHGLDFGIRLLDASLTRESFPIPSILVISAHIDKTEQTKLQDKVAAGCFYGKMLVKGTRDFLKNEIAVACNKVLAYSSVGIHVRDSNTLTYPVISPREEDLLRRSALSLHDVIGVDLSWWSAEILGSASIGFEWTKVLLGRHVLAHGHGASNPRFFKFYSSATSDTTVQSARAAEHHLRHIRVIGEQSSPSRALLVTENATESSERPISLRDYLTSGQRTETSIYEVVQQILRQLKSMGTSTPDAVRLKDFLWKHHDLDCISEQLNRCPREDWISELFESISDPEDLLGELRESENIIHCTRQTLVHGDLHLTNVALRQCEGVATAFIFDTASVVGSAPIERDLASLEVSALLHLAIDPADFKGLCRRWYTDFNGEGKITYRFDLSKNVDALISSLRSVVNGELNRQLYSLFLFDLAAIQLGGLAFGTSGNKVTDPYAAALLARAAAQLYLRHDSPPERAEDASD